MLSYLSVFVIEDHGPESSFLGTLAPVMIISGSPLFKQYARTALDSENRNRRPPYTPLGIADTIVQHLLDLAKLQVTRFKISNATEE